jgi:hypothetical protein
MYRTEKEILLGTIQAVVKSNDDDDSDGDGTQEAKITLAVCPTTDKK